MTVFRSVSALLALLSASALAPPAISADLPAQPPPPPAQTWSFTITPYLWATSLSGFTTVRGRTADVDASFIDIVDRTEFPKNLFQAAAVLEARKGPLSLWADIAYSKVGVTGDALRSRQFSPDIAGSIGASASLRVRLLIAELAAAYEVGRWNDGFGQGGSTAIDLYAGTRVWWQQANLNLSLTGTVTIDDLAIARGRAIARSGDVAWADPMIGVRLRHEFSPAVELVVRADVGGFGAGSDLSWQAIGALNLELFKTATATWSGLVGYKALFVDYEQGSGRTRYRYNMLEYGPIMGISARF